MPMEEMLLKKLAGVLEKNPDIQITIEGHTDNVPYNPGSGQLKDNWDLSVKRATTVVRVLLEGSKIDAETVNCFRKKSSICLLMTVIHRMQDRRTGGLRLFLLLI